MRSAPTVAQLPAPARRYLSRGAAALFYHPYDTATWRVTPRHGPTLYLKAAHAGRYPSLAGERDRLRWLAGRDVSVPEVVDAGADERVEWLVTVALPGLPATDPAHLSRPVRTVTALAEGLRAFHEIDPTGCPFDHTAPAMLSHVAARVAAGDVDPAGFGDEHRHLTPHAALAQLRAMAPEHEDLVVCHGDYCFPNMTLADGRVVGFLDVGEAGLADRWRDLAVATWSTTWNVGPGYEDLFLRAYGSEWDRERTAFYRLLFDLES
jgi:aminoglycoside 3'-phosphotransferase-2